MRANYRIPGKTKKYIINELYLYWKNKKDIEELEEDIIDESPSHPEVNSRPLNLISKPTESKGIKLAGNMSTRALIIAKRRIDYIGNAIKRLNEEDKEVFELIFRDGYSQKLAYTIKGISKDTYYSVFNKIIYLVAIEFGEI